MNNYVILKGKKDRLVIHLNSEVDFLTLRDSLVEKIQEAKNFIGNVHLAIEFSNRVLTELEENVLIDLIKLNSDINITYVFSESGSGVNKKEKIKFFKAVTEEGPTKFFRGTLRSGNKIEYDGNIVVIGDVNPGAMLRAKGNIIVLGHLNGTVYAGLDDDKDAFIGANYMNPIQLVIGSTIAKPMQKEILDTNKVDRKGGFKIAYIKNNEILIEDFSARSYNE